jgi:hypothetical protein
MEFNSSLRNGVTIINAVDGAVVEQGSEQNGQSA